MGLKEEYQEKIEAQLNEWSQKLRELKARAETSAAETKADIDKQMESLRAKLEAAQDKLQKLKAAGVETWEQLKPSLDQSMEDFQKALENIVAMKQAYQEKAAAQIKEWSQRIEAYRAKTEAAAAEARAEMDRQTEKLRGKLAVVQIKMQELQQAGAESWGEVRANLDQALDELNQAWVSAVGMRQAYQEKLETQLKEWSAKIEDLKARAEKATTEARVELNKQVEKMRGLQESAQTRLKEARGAGGEAWEKLKTGLDKTVGEIKSTWDKVASKFRKEGPPGPDKP